MNLVSRNNYLCASTHLHLSVPDTQPSNTSSTNMTQNPLSETPFNVPFILEHALKLRCSEIICSFSDVHHLTNKSYSKGLAINAEHLHLLLQVVYVLNMNETYRSSGVST